LTQGSNLYAYVGKDPIGEMDSLGLAGVPPPIWLNAAQTNLAKQAFGAGLQGASNINQGLLNNASLTDLGVLAHTAERGVMLAPTESSEMTQVLRLDAVNQAIINQTENWGPFAGLAPTAAYYLGVANAPVWYAFNVS